MIKLINLRDQVIGYAATSADQARDLNWNKLKSACEAYEIRSQVTSTVSKVPDVSFLDTKMTLTCNRTGSIYRLRGVEDRRDAEKFRGFPQAEFQVDECGSFPPELLEYLVGECVGPRLGEAAALGGGRGGCIVLGSTPPKVLRGMFYEVTRYGSARHRPYAKRDAEEYAGWKGFSSHAWTLKDVYELDYARTRYPALVANWEEALIEKAEKQWGDDHPIWRREYLGEWSADNTSTVFQYRAHVDGKLWNRWEPHGEQYLEGLLGLKKALEALPKDDAGKPYEWHHAVAIDDGGGRDPVGVNVFSFAPRDPVKRIIHTYSHEQMGLHLTPLAKLLLGEEKNVERMAGIFGLIGWPDAIVMDTGENQILEMQNEHHIRIKRAVKKADYKFGAIELCNGDLIEGRIWIIKGSPLEKQIAALQWKPDEAGNPREDKSQANHSTDCLIYARREIAYLFEAGIVASEAPKDTGGGFKDPMGLDDEIGEDSGGEFSSLLSEPEWGDLGA